MRAAAPLELVEDARRVVDVAAGALEEAPAELAREEPVARLLLAPTRETSLTDC